jgi:SAM-dependent methyltransferase
VAFRSYRSPPAHASRPELARDRQRSVEMGHPRDPRRQNEMRAEDPTSRETAADRDRESVPARIVAHRPRPARLLDFGCGQGRDLEYYRSLGISAEGYDPHWQPRELNAWAGAFDLVVCTYVLNTLPPEPRAAALADIRRVLAPGGRVIISVRDAAEVERERRPTWVRQLDGWRTHRGTFQKGFERDELIELLRIEGFIEPTVLRDHHGITIEAILDAPAHQIGDTGVEPGAGRG